MKIAIIRSCLETLTPRAIKNAQTLASAGHDVIVLAWDREQKNPKLERRDGYQAYRSGPKAPYGARVLFYLPIWWSFEFWWLIRNRWDVVHAMDFDTVPPAMLAAKIKRKPLVYELADIYEDQRAFPRSIRTLFLYLDKMFMRQARAVIIAAEAQIEELDGIPNQNTITIYNSPPDLQQPVARVDQGDTVFTIFYAGALHKLRQSNLDTVFQAIRDIDNVSLVVAGYGDQAGEIERQAKTTDQMQFLGWLSYPETLQRDLTADLLISLYEPTRLNRHSLPNKLFEAMMCGKPILVTKGTAMARVVEKEDCGLVVDSSNVDEIREAITRLREEPELCRQLGANGRKAYEQRYSWEIMAQRLLNLYQRVSG
ncbi:hypothetical protein ES702_02509 [subsurface metagenome]